VWAKGHFGAGASLRIAVISATAESLASGIHRLGSIQGALAMSNTISQPGVFIEEFPIGVHSISGVATSIAAFVGWASRGPIDQAESVQSFAEFTRKFGGFDQRSLLGYAVSQFFANGGAQAFVVRLAMKESPDSAANATTAQAVIDGKISFAAKNAGAWANNYAVAVTRQPPPDVSRFELRILELGSDGTGTVAEVFQDLSMSPTDARFVAKVLADSALVDAAIVGGTTDAPAATVIPANGIVPLANKLSGGADGQVLAPNDPAFESALLPQHQHGGVFALDQAGRFNLLCVPGESNPSVLSGLQSFCRERLAFAIADCAADATVSLLQNGPDNRLTGEDGISSALYFPWILAHDPLSNAGPRAFPPCGFVAGIIARTDTQRGVWHAPAGLEATVLGALGMNTTFSDADAKILNAQAVSSIRTITGHGTVVWGARTLHGGNQQPSEWKYIPVRRMALFLEESLRHGLEWVSFEPNGEPLWMKIRQSVEAFMQSLFQQGAFAGKTAKDAYFVKCGRDTTTEVDIENAVVNVVIGFAPLRPAEFVVLTLQQVDGRVA
jgi:Bacteriophage tail sheath protein